MRGRMAVVFALILCLLGVVRTQNLLQILEGSESLSEFTELAKKEEIAKSRLRKYTVTAFAPNNDAMREFKGEKSKDLVNYHLCNVDLDSIRLKNVRKIISQQSNIPLWVNIKWIGKNSYENEIFINNAKIIRRDKRGETEKTEDAEDPLRQVLHVIDRVLWHVRRRQRDSVENPTAMVLMKGGTSYIIDNLQLTKFASIVENKGKEKLFDSESLPSTFFVPVNRDNNDWEKMDSKTIEAHVVPGEVLFTRTVEEDKEYETAEAQSNSVRIMLQMSSVKLENGTVIWYAKSNTLIGDIQHPKGVVMRKILKANIPVKNGVVHIIEKPLAVIDQTVSAFLQTEKEVRLTKFHELIVNYATRFHNLLLEEGNITLLAPNNEAFGRIESERNSLISDPEKLKTVLSFHLVKGMQISHLDEQQTLQVNSKECQKDDWCVWAKRATTVDNDNQVYFRLIKSHLKGDVLTVDGGGVNATVKQPDIATKNGIVHIIDRVLGIPFTTVGARLEEDPEVSKTAELGRQKGFNKILTNKKNRFTYFVPNNDAWERIGKNMPSAKKKLFMGNFSYQTIQILERHLLVENSYTMADLYQMSRGKNKTIAMKRGHLKIAMRDRDGGYQLIWDGKTANVVRPDVKCTNGMIHVIDTVMMERGDVTVSVATSLGASILTMLALLFTAKYL